MHEFGFCFSEHATDLATVKMTTRKKVKSTGVKGFFGDVILECMHSPVIAADRKGVRFKHWHGEGTTRMNLCPSAYQAICTCRPCWRKLLPPHVGRTWHPSTATLTLSLSEKHLP